MTSVWSLLGHALAALFAIAVGVACWEQWRGAGRRAVLAAAAERLDAAAEHTSAPPSPLSTTAVDILIEPPAGPDAAAAATPQGVLGEALGRMTRGTPPPSRTTLWLDTQPITTPMSGPAAPGVAAAAAVQRRTVELPD